MPATGDGRASTTAGTTGAADAADIAHRPGATTGVPATRATTDAAAGRSGKRADDVRSRTGAPAGATSCEGAGDPTAEAKPGMPIPHPRATTGDARATNARGGDARPAAVPPSGPRRGGGRGEPPYRLLVIEDGSSDLDLIETLVAESSPHVELHRARGIEQASALLSPAPGTPRRSLPSGGFNCVLIDLAATGSDGLDGLRELLRCAPHTAVVVLTDAAGAELGAAAVAAGAQDFLIKHETDGPLLARALRYAVERKRADESQRRLVEAELRGQENARLQRHLLPTPLLDGADLSFTRRYRPGRRRALLGGDFYDAVRTDDGTVHVVIGDVCGHGPDEAALGVALRIAWRTLVFAGLTGQTLLTTLQHVLEHERRSDEIFATLCMLVISPGTEGLSGSVQADPAERAKLYLAGHPAPLLLGPDTQPGLLPTEQAGPALGLLPCDDDLAAWPAQELDLPPGWRLMLYTDGLVEGRVGAGSRRLGQEGLIELIADHQANGLSRGRLVDSALAEVEELNGGALADDVAVLLLERNQSPALLG